MSEVRVVAVEGDVDISRAPALRDELRRSVSNQDVGLVVDLGPTNYLDSAGVNTLFEVAEELRDRQLGFAVVVPEGSLVERVITLVDLAAAAVIHRTVDDARRALES
jgi:anti-sigma B factor antagonist